MIGTPFTLDNICYKPWTFNLTTEKLHLETYVFQTRLNNRIEFMRRLLMFQFGSNEISLKLGIGFLEINLNYLAS